jgi:hypothetical protein
MTSTVPVSRVVAVSVTLTPAGALAQSLANMLLLGVSTVIDTVERTRNYSDLSGVTADFGTSALEYLAAAEWFGQSPQPTQLTIGRWLNAAASGGLRCAPRNPGQQLLSVFTAITAGGFTVNLDGGANTNVTGLNFSGATNLNAVAALIQAALTGVTCLWNASYQRFEFQSTTTGVLSAVSFLAPPAGGTDISGILGGRSSSSGAYVYVGAAAESALACVSLMDLNLGQRWYSCFVLTAADADHVAIAGFLEATNTKHIYAITTQEAGVLVAATTSDIASQLKALGYSRTFVQYSGTNPYASMSAMARILTTDFSGSNTVITLKFKQEPGVVPETLNVNQVNAAEAKNANLFLTYNNDTSILEQGVMANGVFVDIVTGTDWLATQIQTSIYNLLYTSPTKIPQTDQGMQLLTTQVANICSQGVVNGLIAPGVWNSNGFGILKSGDFMASGFYIYAPPVASQNQAARAARMAVPIQVAVKLAGAIHTASVAILVNQ